MKKIVRYACSICKTEYETNREAVTCEAKGLDAPVAKVGDIVFVRAGFGWFDGDKRWVSNRNVLEKVPKPNPHGNCFGECCTFQFYYVVTAIDNDGHRRRYHIMTKAMSGKQGHRGGYTFGSHHVTMRVVKKPPLFVTKDSEDLIGQNTPDLY